MSNGAPTMATSGCHESSCSGSVRNGRWPKVRDPAEHVAETRAARASRVTANDPARPWRETTQPADHRSPGHAAVSAGRRSGNRDTPNRGRGRRRTRSAQGGERNNPLNKSIPHLWYVDQAQEAAEFYVSIFPDSRIDRVTSMPSESPSGPAGSVDVVEFTLFGQSFMAISAGQARRLQPFGLVHRPAATTRPRSTATGTRSSTAAAPPKPCGWVRDKFGLSLAGRRRRCMEDMMADSDREKARRATDAMLLDGEDRSWRRSRLPSTASPCARTDPKK